MVAIAARRHDGRMLRSPASASVRHLRVVPLPGARVGRGLAISATVADGLAPTAPTARAVTAAAAIMICVFGSFVPADLPAIALIGLGLAVAVLVDTTLEGRHDTVVPATARELLELR